MMIAGFAPPKRQTASFFAVPSVAEFRRKSQKAVAEFRVTDDPMGADHASNLSPFTMRFK
jgi:hypothetical protein